MKRMCAVVVLVVVTLHAHVYGQDANEIVDELRRRAGRIATFEVEFEHVLRNVRDDGDPMPPVRTRWIGKEDRMRFTVHVTDTEGQWEPTQDQSEVDGVRVNYAPRRNRATISETDEQGPTHLLRSRRLFPLLLGRVFERAELVSAELEDGELVVRWAYPGGPAPQRDILARFAAEAPYPVRAVAFGEDLDEPGPRTEIEFAGENALDDDDIVLPAEARRLMIDAAGEVLLRLDSRVREADVNGDLPDEAFEIEMPEGVDVIRHRLNPRLG